MMNGRKQVLKKNYNSVRSHKSLTDANKAKFGPNLEEYGEGRGTFNLATKMNKVEITPLERLISEGIQRRKAV